MMMSKKRIETAIQYFEQEIRFCENAPALNGCEMTDDWLLTLEVSKLAVDALRAAQERESNPYWASVCEMADKQRAKGMRTYGKGLEDNPLSFVERLDYLAEELIDGLMYIQHIKAYHKVKTKADVIRAMSDEELAEWLASPGMMQWCPRSGPCPAEVECDDCWAEWLKKPAEEEANV